MIQRLPDIIRYLLFVSMCMVAGNAQALITIEIDKGVKAGLPIAVVPFANGDITAVDFMVDEVIRNDLQRTGRFNPLSPSDFISSPTQQEQVLFSDWRLLKSDYLVIGGFEEIQPTVYKFRVQLFDVLTESQIFGRRYTIVPDQLRATAHQIANSIFNEITGEKSSFDSQIAFVSTEQGQGGNVEHVLYISDYDGYNPQSIVRQSSPIFSPTWSPDSTQIAYSVLEQNGSRIYIQNLDSGVRIPVVETDFQASSPSWSPDGEKLAFTILQDGNSEIYVSELANGSLVRVTNNEAIDTEPSWSPDSESLIFTSSRGGSTQIYSVPVYRAATPPRRITFDGRSNASATYDPKGENLLLISQFGAGYQVSRYEIDNNSLVSLVQTSFTESPNFSPNGDMVVYIVEGVERRLMTMSPDGEVRIPIRTPTGQIKQVSWEKRTE